MVSSQEPGSGQDEVFAKGSTQCLPIVEGRFELQPQFDTLKAAPIGLHR